jgi:hypothetical protein
MSFIKELKEKVAGKVEGFKNDVMTTARGMSGNDDAVSASELPILFIGLAIGITVMSSVIPGSFSTLFEVNTSGWPPAVVALFDVIPIVIIAGIVMVFYGWYRNK